MKFVTHQINNQDVIYVFPRSVNHDHFAESIESIRFSDYDCDGGNLISAGFVEGRTCEGASGTLDLCARKNLDSFHLRTQAFRAMRFDLADRPPLPFFFPAVISEEHMLEAIQAIRFVDNRSGDWSRLLMKKQPMRTSMGFWLSRELSGF